MIELFISVVASALVLYAVWRSLDVTSCQRELRALERRVNGFHDDMLEWINRTDRLEDKAGEFERWDQDIRGNIREMDKLHGNWIKSLTDRVNEQHETLKGIDDDINNINHRLGEHRQEVDNETKQCAKLLGTMIQEVRGDLSVTNVSVEELKVQLIKYQAEQQRMQSTMKENRDALVKWFGGGL